MSIVLARFMRSFLVVYLLHAGCRPALTPLFTPPSGAAAVAAAAAEAAFTSRFTIFCTVLTTIELGWPPPRLPLWCRRTTCSAVLLGGLGSASSSSSSSELTSPPLTPLSEYFFICARWLDFALNGCSCC
uniref:Putative secreted protein n=1 Tax=Anopheles darlingi TaxID=43151 RepID=A0A2M4D349_ANODA